MRFHLCFIALALCVTGCGEGTGADAGALTDAGVSRDASASDGGASDAGSMDAGAADAGTDAGSSDAGGDGSDAGSDAAVPGDGGTGLADAGTGTSVTLRDVAAYANCMPTVSPDPIIVFWTVDVSDAVGPMATVTDAKLTVTGSSIVMQSLNVDTPSFALSGGSASQMQRKTAAPGTPMDACRTLCGAGTTYELELTYDIGGVAYGATDTGSFSCVY